MGVVRVGDRAAIAPLFAGWQENLIRSTLDGCMGNAFTNEAFTAAQIVNGDFAFLAGDASCADALALVSHVPEDFQAKVMIVAASDAAWHPVIEQAFGERAERGERYAIRKEGDCFDRARLQALTRTLPEGARLCPMDGALYHTALEAAWSRDLVSQFRDAADYEARGLGVMAFLNGEPVAGASSYVVFSGGVEVEVDTHKAFRRRGLAAACGAALMLACLARGLYPSWDAANPASVALAEKLGYRLDHPYPVYHIRLQG